VIRLAVSMGDPAGIGPELLWAVHRAALAQGIKLIAVGDRAALEAAPGSDRLGQGAGDTLAFEPVGAACPRVTPGAQNPAAAPAIIAAIAGAVALVKHGEADAVLTMPIAKHVLQAAGFGFPGHTEYLAHLTQDMPMTGPRGPIMLLSGAGLRVALATIHVPLKAVPEALTQARILHVCQVAAHALKQDFAIPHPRLALCGLNPHAGENGALGREEIDVIAPAAALLRAQGIDVSDPLPADSLFHPGARAGYDAVVAMYHDQGLGPIKTIAFDEAVNVTLGLPIVRTSPDHGVAFDIAGRGVARADSAIAAMQLAAQMVRARHGR
jgi:4-hydroxythreonine-4-phosphate dehydrogenase